MEPDKTTKRVSRSSAPFGRDGFITFLVERLFFCLEYSFQLQRVFGLKPRNQHHLEDLAGVDPVEREKRVSLNALRSDRYITAFVIFEVLALCWAITHECTWQSGRWPIIFTGLCCYRVIDIVQNIVNRLVFSPLRGSDQHRIASGTRTLVLTVIFYLEMIACFAVIDLRSLACLTANGLPVSGSDALYFSAITQLTIGYGDISPHGILRFVSAIQGLLGFFFTAIIIARLVSTLPNLSGDLEKRIGGEIDGNSLPPTV